MIKIVLKKQAKTQINPDFRIKKLDLRKDPFISSSVDFFSLQQVEKSVEVWLKFQNVKNYWKS